MNLIVPSFSKIINPDYQLNKLLRIYERSKGDKSVLTQEEA